MFLGGNFWADRCQQEEKFSSILEVKMPQHLSDEQRHLIVYLHKKGISERKIASEVGCSKTGVNVTIKRWKETGKFEERPGRGRKMKSTIRQDRALVRLSLSDRRLTSSELCKDWRQSTGVEVSISTIRKRLLGSGLRGCKAKKNQKSRKSKERPGLLGQKSIWTRQVRIGIRSYLVMRAHLLSKIMLETTLFEEDLMKRSALSAFCLQSSIQQVWWFGVVWHHMALEDCTSVRDDECHQICSCVGNKIACQCPKFISRWKLDISRWQCSLPSSKVSEKVDAIS